MFRLGCVCGTLCVLLAMIANPAYAYSDPFAYCAAMGTIDAPDLRYTGQPPISLAEKVFDWLPGTLTERMMDWRCVDGHLFICVSGNAPVCGPLVTARNPTPELRQWCNENPNSGDVPMFVIGHQNAYDWSCQGRTPTITRKYQIDSRGFWPWVWKRAYKMEYRTSKNVQPFQCRAERPITLPEHAAKECIQQLLDNTHLEVVLGENNVSASQKLSERQISDETFALYQELSKDGYVTLEVEDLTKEFTGWGAWLDLTVKGIRKRVNLALTSRASEIGWIITDGDRDIFQFPIGQFEVLDIVRNEVIRHDSDDYALIAGTYRANWMPSYRSARAIAKVELSDRRRFRVLLIYDHFAHAWRYVAADYANQGEDFTTNEVNQKLH